MLRSSQRYERGSSEVKKHSCRDAGHRPGMSREISFFRSDFCATSFLAGGSRTTTATKIAIMARTTTNDQNADGHQTRKKRLAKTAPEMAPPRR